MQTTPHSRRLIILFALLLMGILIAAPAQAAPPTSVDHRPTQCIPAKHIQNWRSIEQLDQKGFNTVVEGDLATVDFDGNLLLGMAGSSANNQDQASRATETDADLPIAQRVKCWQASPGQDVVVEFRERFNESAAPLDLEEDLFLWNAPFAGPNNPDEPSQLLTAIGVSRTSAFGPPIYVAEVVQDLDVMTFSGLFLFDTEPLPSWLDAADWHNVRITLSQTHATIEIAQGDHPFESVLQTTMLHPAEPLGFEFSVDTSEQIVQGDGLNISCLDIRNEPSNITDLPVRPSRCHN